MDIPKGSGPLRPHRLGSPAATRELGVVATIRQADEARTPLCPFRTSHAKSTPAGRRQLPSSRPIARFLDRPAMHHLRDHIHDAMSLRCSRAPNARRGPGCPGPSLALLLDRSGTGRGTWWRGYPLNLRPSCHEPAKALVGALVPTPAAHPLPTRQGGHFPIYSRSMSRATRRQSVPA